MISEESKKVLNELFNREDSHLYEHRKTGVEELFFPKTGIIFVHSGNFKKEKEKVETKVKSDEKTGSDEGLLKEIINEQEVKFKQVSEENKRFKAERDLLRKELSYIAEKNEILIKENKKQEIALNRISLKKNYLLKKLKEANEHIEYFNETISLSADLFLRLIGQRDIQKEKTENNNTEELNKKED